MRRAGGCGHGGVRLLVSSAAIRQKRAFRLSLSSGSQHGFVFWRLFYMRNKTRLRYPRVAFHTGAIVAGTMNGPCAARTGCPRFAKSSRLPIGSRLDQLETVLHNGLSAPLEGNRFDFNV